jgi:hypothetical protein
MKKQDYKLQKRLEYKSKVYLLVVYASKLNGLTQ